MKRYVKYRQACNWLAVLFYPQVCSRCKTPYREGPVMREVD